ncbi:MAG: TonB-dependent receptor [Candidatus Azobacteroides sp.]|nr:TonB-dependent receptor [Candidatus Azobacteroides sp.]
MKPAYFTILVLLCSLSLQAQNTTRNDSLMNRELTLEKEYNPTIRDAVKLSQLPELREPQAPKSKVEFSDYATPFDVQSRVIPLSPQAYLTHLNYSKYRGYLTGGISTLVDIDGDLGYQILNSDQDRLNIFFSHRSSRSDVSYLQDVSYLDETGKQKFKINDNWGGINYLHDFGGIKLNADAKYTYSAFNYYGLSIPYNIYYIMPGPQPNNNFDKNTNQTDQLFEAHIGLASDKANELNYKINVGYTNFRQKYGNTINEDGSKENRILIDGDIHKLLSSTMGIGLSGSMKNYSYGNKAFKSTNDSTTNYWTYFLNPYLYWEDTNWNLLLGAKMDVEVGGRGKIIASPTIRLNYSPTNRFMFYLLADGGIKDNSQYNLYYENRYVDPSIRVADSRSPLDATAGIKFIPLPTFSVGIFGGYIIMKDEHFYYSNVGAKNFDESTPMLSGNWITPIYEDANTFRLGADFKYAFQDIFEIGLKGTYYYRSISTDNDVILHKAWNKPDFEMNLNAAYCSPWIPLRFDLSYLSAFGRKATDSSLSNILHMKNIHDLSVKATYSITSNFSVYGSLNNLLFSKYDFWWGYPAQKFNIMGGISILF